VSDSAPSYALLTVTEEFEQLCERLIAEGRPFGFDIESSYDGEPRSHAQLHPEENFPCGLSLTNSLAWARYAPLRHDSGLNLDSERCARVFWKLLRTGLGVAHGAKFELRVLSRWFLEYLSDDAELGEEVRAANGYFPVRSCTLLESYAEAANRSHGLKDITLHNFHHKMAEIFDLFPSNLTKKEQDRIRFSELDQNDPKVISYACEDALWALAHHLRRYPLVKDSFIYQLEMNVLPVVYEMEDEGVRYDWNFMRDGCARCSSFRDRLGTEVSNDLTALVQAKDPQAQPVRLNLGSPKQIGDVLYGQLGMVSRRRTKSGKMSTDKVAMKGLSQQYPVVRKILTWKSLTKLQGTYLEVYEGEYSYAPDGRAHPSFLQHGVPAGRFAAAEPPVQQSPKKYHCELADGTTFDFSFRDAICAPPGWYILGYDYSQIELRVLAGEAGETALIEAFARGEDVHRKTAALMLGKPLGQVTDEDRQLGKTMNFALGYQMGVDGLADRLGITKDEAQRLFDQYFGVYTRIKAYMERTVAGAKSRGYVTTRFGRVVRIWEFLAAERYVYAEGERLAGNAPIQGGAADYMKIAMVRARRALRQAGLTESVRLFLNMHDALDFYVRDDIPPAQVIRVLQPAVVFPVDGWPPMVAEWHAGRRWGSVRQLELLADGSVAVKQEEAPAPQGTTDGDPDEEDASPGIRWSGAPAAPASRLPSHSSGGAARGAGLWRGPDQPDRAAEPDAGTPDTPPREVIITVTHMPTQAQYEEFCRMAFPGPHPAVLRTPQGDVQLAGCIITPAHEPRVSMALGGASVAYASGSLDTSGLVGLVR
jgi:DNA polymerase I-like protein with 3'-5' exonuclease and polymerase domains